MKNSASEWKEYTSGVIFWRENARFSRCFQNSRAQMLGREQFSRRLHSSRAEIFRARDFYLLLGIYMLSIHHRAHVFSMSP